MGAWWGRGWGWCALALALGGCMAPDDRPEPIRLLPDVADAADAGIAGTAGTAGSDAPVCDHSADLAPAGCCIFMPDVGAVAACVSAVFDAGQCADLFCELPDCTLVEIPACGAPD